MNSPDQWENHWDISHTYPGLWPLKNMKVNWDDYSQYMWKNKSHVPVTTNRHMISSDFMNQGKMGLKLGPPKWDPIQISYIQCEAP